VAVLGLAVVAQFRVASQPLGEEPGGGGELLLAGGDPGEGQAFGAVFWSVLAPQQCRQSPRQGQLVFGPRQPLRRGVPPARPARAQLVSLPEHLQGPREVAPRSEDVAKVTVGLGVIGLEPNRLAVAGEGLVLLASAG